MTSFFLRAACGFAGVLGLLAAPGAAAPDTAPMPRAAAPKFVAPKFNDSFEVLLYTSQRPVRARLTVLQEGKPIGELWGERLKKAFDYCDRDGDGTLNAKEVSFAFSDSGMSQLLQNGFYQPGQTASPTLARIDKDGDGTVTFTEFAAAYPLTSAQLIRPQPIQPDYNNNAPVTEAVFKLLDANGDGKLTKAEVAAVEKLLATRDADEDECLSAQELVPNLNVPVRGGRQPLPLQPNGGAYAPPSDGVRQTVVVYEGGKVPGLVTQNLIKMFDKDKDFELTRTEIGFDDVTFKALDKDGNGKLDGEELDVWRTGAPDVEITLSMAPKAVDCVAKLADEKGAAARGFKLKQVENGRLVLHVGRQPVDFSAFAPVNQYGQQSLKVQYGYMFQQAAGAKGHVEEKDLTGPNAINFQFVKVMFEAADRDADGKMTKAEFDAYFDLQDSFRNLSLSLTPSVQTPSLFQLLDENRDGRLSVRELRTAWGRLLVLEEPGAEVITKGIIQPTVHLRLSRSFDRYYVNQPMNPVYYPNQTQPVAPSRGPVWFRKMDRNGDGDVSRTEYVGTRAEFDAIDADRDGLISLGEAEEYDSKTREKDKPEAKPDEKPTPQPGKLPPVPGEKK